MTPRIKSIALRDIDACRLERDTFIATFAVEVHGIELRECELVRRPDNSCFVVAPIVSRKSSRQNASFVLRSFDLRDVIVAAAEDAYRRLGGTALGQIANGASDA